MLLIALPGDFLGLFQSICISKLFSYQLNFGLISQAESWRIRSATIYCSTCQNYCFKVFISFQLENTTQ